MITTIKEPHWDAKLYKKNSIKLQQTSAVELLEKLTFKNDSYVLDVGCGDGKISVIIAKNDNIASIVGTDLSRDMIELAKQDYAHLKKMKFLVQNAENIHFIEPFDWVLSFFCLQWVNNKQKAFQGIASALKPGGQFALIMTNRNPILLRSRHDLISEPQWKPYFIDYEDTTSMIDDDAYETYARKAGLKDLVYTEQEKTIHFESKAELVTFINMVTPAKIYLPTIELQTLFINELTDMYINILQQLSDEHWAISYTIKTLQGKK